MCPNCGEEIVVVQQDPDTSSEVESIGFDGEVVKFGDTSLGINNDYTIKISFAEGNTYVGASVAEDMWQLRGKIRVDVSNDSRRGEIVGAFNTVYNGGFPPGDPSAIPVEFLQDGIRMNYSYIDAFGIGPGKTVAHTRMSPIVYHSILTQFKVWNEQTDLFELNAQDAENDPPTWEIWTKK